MDTTLFVIQLLNGVQLGILLFLVASGLTLVFGILDFVNLAHGAVYMLGAFICASLTFLTGSFVLAVILALPIVALAGFLLERFIARPLYERDHLEHVLGTFGAILVIDTLAHLIWGPAGIAIPLPPYLDGQIEIWSGIVVPTFRLTIIAAGLAAVLVLATGLASAQTLNEVLAGSMDQGAGGVAGAVAAAEAKRRKPMDSSAGSAISAPVPRRK